LRAFEDVTLQGGSSGHRILRAVATSLHRRLKTVRQSVVARVRVAAVALCSSRSPVRAPSWSAPPDDVARILASLPALSALAGVEIEQPSRVLQTAALARGAEFDLEPCTAGDAMVLLRGAVSPCLGVEAGLAVSLPVVAPGGFVDYGCALDGGAAAAFWGGRSASVIARLPARAFAAESRSGAELLYALCRDLAMTLRTTTGLAMHLGMTWDHRDGRGKEYRQAGM